MYSDNLWAEEMGIDLGELQRESPMHPDQLKLKRKLSKQADEYWARERFLAQMGKNAADVIYDIVPEPVKIAKKTAKVGRYDFTDQQLQIAMRSLDANDTVREVRV